MSGYQGSYGGFTQEKKGFEANYTVDMVLCIDATGSMEDMTGRQKRLINMVKENAINLHSDIKKAMANKNKPLAQLRVRIIIFRDFIADGSNAIMATDFFCLPEQTESFEKCIKSIRADGGGDPPEDGLEALSFAMRSKWTTQGVKKRQVIVVWTDAGTHKLGHGKSSPYYPKDMPANLAELEDIWDGMDEYAKRLVLFTPNENFWNYIADNWDKTYHFQSVAGEGMAETDYQSIISMIVNTFTA